ncbi:Sodium/glycine symporter GlyP [hydrothermal vent metagenome]|uniref:Sodium/glycine symporter GlyP n=1 Tax=hydrothermal vent metagenome TaxID=652676 RepID=A0A3B0XP06_9ZZZZ
MRLTILNNGYPFLPVHQYVTLEIHRYILLIVVRVIVALQRVWNIADIMNILMAIPNLVALVLLSARVKKMKDTYFEKHR